MSMSGVRINRIEVESIEHIGRRPYMEDRTILEANIFNGWSLFAVCDGHGGDYVCNFLKANFKDLLVENMKLNENMAIAIDQTFAKIAHQMDMENAKYQGSTICALLIKGNMIISINTGDSRAIMGFMDSSVDLTVDHKPNEPSEEKRILNEGGFVTHREQDVPRVNGNLALSRSVGDFYLFPYVISNPDIRQFDMSTYEESYIVIATDGILDVWTSGEIIKALSIGLKCNDFINLSLQRGSTDNMSMIVLHKTVETK